MYSELCMYSDNRVNVCIVTCVMRIELHVVFTHALAAMNKSVLQNIHTQTT